MESAEADDEGREEDRAGGRSTSVGVPVEHASRTTVSAMILTSSHSDQRSMYSMSYWMRFSSDVLPRSPLTCAQPVIPDFTLWRSM